MFLLLEVGESLLSESKLKEQARAHAYLHPLQTSFRERSPQVIVNDDSLI